MFLYYPGLSPWACRATTTHSTRMFFRPETGQREMKRAHGFPFFSWPCFQGFDVIDLYKQVKSKLDHLISRPSVPTLSTSTVLSSCFPFRIASLPRDTPQTTAQSASAALALFGMAFNAEARRVERKTGRRWSVYQANTLRWSLFFKDWMGM